MPLATDNDATYADDGRNPSRKQHQQDHDALAAQHNAWEDIDPSGLASVDALAAKADDDAVVKLAGAQTVAGAKRHSAVATFDSLIRVKGRRYADVTHPDFGADPTSQVANAHTAIKNAFDSLAPGGTLRIPGGEYVATAQLLLSGKTGIKFDTDGLDTTISFSPASPLTDALRIVDCPQLALVGMHVRNVGGAAITNLLTLTTTSSAQVARLQDLVLDPQVSGVTNCLAIAPDSHGDLANIILDNVYTGGVGCSGSALSLGDGVSGNVVNIRAFACNFGLGLYGVKCNGANLQMFGGSFQTNSGADVKLLAQSGSPLVINGVRGEGSKMFWEYLGNGQAAFPIVIDGVTVYGFTHPSAIIMAHAAVHAVDLRNLTMYGGVGPAKFNFTAGLQRGAVHARNILTESDNPFIPHQNVTINWVGPRRRINVDGVVDNITAPVLTALAAAGSGATLTMTGNDLSGTLTLTTGTGPTSGAQGRIAYATVLTTGTALPPIVNLMPQTAATAALQACVTSRSHTQFEITTLAPAPSTSYVWTYGQAPV